jgi:bacterioferritin-associated ferredoxin
MHVCQAVTEKEIDDTIIKAIYGMNGLQKELANMEGLRK